jgi:hypothetical protein
MREFQFFESIIEKKLFLTVNMTLKFSLTVSDNLQIFGFFLLKLVSSAKNSIWTSGVNDFYPQCFVELSGYKQLKHPV